MAEDAWLKCEREWFITSQGSDFDVPAKKLNKAIEAYNRFLQKALVDESPYVAENLKLTILNSRGTIDPERKD